MCQYFRRKLGVGIGGGIVNTKYSERKKLAFLSKFTVAFKCDYFL